MQYLAAVHAATPPVPGLTQRQHHRLGTANMVLQSLAVRGARVFGTEDKPARVELRRDGQFCFVPARADADPVLIEGPVEGRERMVPGFRGSYAEQRMVRCLVTFIREGRRVNADQVAQTLMSGAGTYFDQIEPHFRVVMDEFRFANVFNKPVSIHPMRGPSA